MTAPLPLLDASAVLGLLPHRYPLLLVDRMTVVEPGRRARGLKRVTSGEWLAAERHDERPPGAVMPGLLAVEALAQTAAAVLAGLVGATEGVVGYFAAIERVRLRAPARAGDTLVLDVELRSFRRGVARLHGLATVDDRLVAAADFTTIVRAREAR